MDKISLLKKEFPGWAEEEYASVQITISAGGLVRYKNENKYIIIEQDINEFSLPKGHSKGNENLEETAKREIYEEAGVSELVLVKPLGNYYRLQFGSTKKVKNIYLFLFTTSSSELKPTHKDSISAKWVTFEQLCNLLTAKKDSEFLKSIEI